MKRERSQPRSPGLEPARLVTDLLNPFFVFTALYVAVAFSEAGALPGVGYVALEALAAGIVAGYVLLMRRRRRVGDFWISSRAERLVPALFLLVAFVLLLAALVVTEAPEKLFLLVLSMGIASALIALLTLFWKASAHCAVAGHAALAGVILLGWPGVVFVLVLLAVVRARTRPEAHTLAQTVVGALVGAALAAVFLL